MKTLLLGAAALAGAALLPAPAQALDYSGYFRGGPGLTRSGAGRACYHLGGPAIARGLSYRLGNECDLYGEFQLDQAFKKDDLDYGGTLMVKSYTNATDNADSNGLSFEQLYAEVKGVDILPEASFWIGKRRGRRGDVHIVDQFFTDMRGVGAGVSGISAGGGKLGFAWYHTDGGYDPSAALPANRLNAEWLGLDSNPGGKANLFATVTQGDFTGGTAGYGLTLRHDQTGLFGTSLLNTLWLSMAAGSTSLESNFGDQTLKPSARSYRVVESINWQIGRFGGQALALLGTAEDNAGKRTVASTVGGRISYGLTRHLKLVVELGLSQYKPEGQAAARLDKLTIAPTLSIDNTFWSRPELRFYVTTARWSAAAGNVTGVPQFAAKTSGTSAGAQVEWWF